MPAQEDNQDQCEVRYIHREQVDAAQARALPDAEIIALSGLFKAMADPNRLRILWALAHTSLCVCDLAALLGCSESAVSHQLRLLRTMALVKNRREGQVLYYQLDDDHVHDLIQLALEHVRE